MKNCVKFDTNAKYFDLKFYFEQSHAAFLFLAAALAALGLSMLLYRQQKKEAYFSSIQISVLTVLRFLSLFILMFLLLGPAIELYKHLKLKPVLVVAVDNSESVKNEKELCEELINRAKKTFPDYETEFWTFGEKAKQSDKITASEVRSDYTGLFKTVRDENIGKKIGALVLVGDGLFNSGTDPLFDADALPFPVFTVGIGDSTSKADAAIVKVIHNPTAYLDNYFPLEINLSYSGFSGRTSTLTIWEDGEQIYRSLITVANNDFFKQEIARLQAKSAGLHHYQVEIEQFAEESNIVNNRFEFSIRVIEQKQKILIAAHGSDPDVAALVKVIEPQKSFSYELLTDPKKQINPEDYDLFILHQLPDAYTANSLLIQQILKSKRPVLWLVGSQTSLSILNNLNIGFSLGSNQGFELAFPAWNKNFNLFRTNSQLPEQTKNWSPLQTPFADVQLKGEWQVLFYQQIQQIETQRPLVFLGRPEKVKYGVIMGDGIWQWRLQDYVQHGSFDLFDELILKIVNYLIVKPGEDNFTVYFQSQYAEDQDIGMTAELLNESFEPVVGPEVSIQLNSESGSSYKYSFDIKTDRYSLNAGQLPSGDYTFDAQTQLGDKNYVETGAFSIDKLQLEQQNTQANFNLLFQLAARTGGSFVTAAHFEKTVSDINKRQSSVTENAGQLIYEKFISLKLVFIFLILLLSLEWFLRKFWGSY